MATVLLLSVAAGVWPVSLVFSLVALCSGQTAHKVIHQPVTGNQPHTTLCCMLSCIAYIQPRLMVWATYAEVSPEYGKHSSHGQHVP